MENTEDVVSLDSNLATHTKEIGDVECRRKASGSHILFMHNIIENYRDCKEYNAKIGPIVDRGTHHQKEKTSERPKKTLPENDK